MPMSRTISTGSATSSSAPKRRALPFKPPGPAKKPKTGTTTSTASKAATSTKPTSKQKGKQAAATLISSDDEDGEAFEPTYQPAAVHIPHLGDIPDEFGDSINLSSDTDARLPVAPSAKARAPTTAAVSKPKAKPTARRSAATTTKRPSSPSPSPLLSQSQSSSPPPPAPVQPARQRTQNQPPDNDHLNEPFDASDDEIPGLPPQLLTRLVHEHCEDKTLRIGKAANKLLGTYVNVFVREAVARAALGKREREGLVDGDGAASGAGGGGVRAGRDLATDDVWLDTEDLERVAPLLIMDF